MRDREGPSTGPEQVFDFSLQVSCALHPSDECSQSTVMSSEAIPLCVARAQRSKCKISLTGGGVGGNFIV